MQAVTSINNVIVGRVHLEHKGSWRLRGLQSGLSACMKLHAATLLTSKSKLHEVILSCPDTHALLLMLECVLSVPAGGATPS